MSEPRTKSGTDAVEKPTKVEVGQRWAFVNGRYVVQSIENDGWCTVKWDEGAITRHPFYSVLSDTFLGYAETPGEAHGRVADPCTCNDCGECFLAKAVKPAKFHGQSIVDMVNIVAGAVADYGRLSLGSAPMTALQALRKVRGVLLPLESDQRLEVLRSIGFCLECGGEDPEGVCQCWNDE